MIDINDLRIRDPFVLHQDDVYYMYGNGLDEAGKLTIVCYTSKDMKTFDDPINILGTHNYYDYKDFWAPEVIKYMGRYYLVMTMSSPSGHRGSYIFVGDTPLGPFHSHGQGLITPSNMMCLDGHIFVEDNQPYLFFCHEWVECLDGEILVAKLDEQLTEISEKPVLLFKASQAPWARPLAGQSYVTDGPFVINRNGRYHMLWSSFSAQGYALGLAYADNLFGPWLHHNEPLYQKDGGHGMIFVYQGTPTIIIHSPNSNNERAVLLPL